MNPARKEKNGRGRNEHESILRNEDILWKTFLMSSTGIFRTSIPRQQLEKASFRKLAEKCGTSVLI